MFSSYTRSSGTQNTHWIACLIAGILLPAITLIVHRGHPLTQAAAFGLSAVCLSLSFLYRRNSRALTVPSLSSRRTR